jgi:hypothetical protein
MTLFSCFNTLALWVLVFMRQPASTHGTCFLIQQLLTAAAAERWIETGPPTCRSCGAGELVHRERGAIGDGGCTSNYLIHRGVIQILKRHFLNGQCLFHGLLSYHFGIQLPLKHGAYGAVCSGLATTTSRDSPRTHAVTVAEEMTFSDNVSQVVRMVDKEVEVVRAAIRLMDHVFNMIRNTFSPDGTVPGVFEGPSVKSRNGQYSEHRWWRTDLYRAVTGARCLASQPISNPYTVKRT